MKIKIDIFNFNEDNIPKEIYDIIKKFEDDFDELIYYDKIPINNYMDTKKEYFNEYIKISSKKRTLVYTYSKTYKMHSLYRENYSAKYSYTNPYSIYNNDSDNKTKENNIDNYIYNTTYASTNAPIYVPIAEYNFNITHTIP